ncbi:AAA family ATPase [Corynebacterium aquatimens]|uniref:DNA repair exonuclease SbcCD ATPase subunit n=1 Tax=Corynebacterium aquatimens TaxID=1190508 RepID=A0A931E2J4_9CORY|nr:AAA family ATPase [Corynebacterium aquatimens]MBG6121338.1 DNA repair exonuclease SbcCD ATPase subunit [Corynebacterium aquatimens]WJY66115.1 chromosome segregation protein [Corynebacterium aquatimens]
MRIHSLILDNVRAVEHLELNDLPDTGVILIYGDNEAGKSTILDALDAVLNIKHTANTVKTRALKPVGKDVSPEVTLSATIGPYEFTIYKRFGGTRGKAELTITAPTREQLSGEEAYNRLNQIVEEYVDTQLKEALFVRQGQLDHAVAAAGIPALASTMESSARRTDSHGQSLSERDQPARGQGNHEYVDRDVDDTGLMERVRSEYEKYFTKKGGSTKLIKDAESAVESAEEAVREATENKKAYEADVDEYARCRDEEAEITAELPEAQEALARREADAEAANALAGQLEQAREKVARAEQDRDHARTAVELRAKQVAELSTQEAELAAIRSGLEEAQEKAAAEQDTITAAEEAYTTAKEESQLRARNLAHAKEQLAAVDARERIAELEVFVDTIDGLNTKIRGLVAALPQRVLNDDDVRALEKLASDVTVQRTVVDSAAARFEITHPTGATITLDDTRIDVPAGPDTTSVPLADGATLAIADFALTYRAAPGTDTATSKLRDAELKFTNALAELGCDSVETARALRDEHRERTAELAAIRRQRTDAAAGRDLDEAREELKRLRSTAAESHSDDHTHSDDNAHRLIAHEDAKNNVALAESAYEDARTTAHEAEVRLISLKAMPHARSLAELETRIGDKAAAVERARADLTSMREKTADDELHGALTSAEQNLDTTRKEHDDIAQRVAAVDPGTAEKLLAGARNRVNNLDQRRVRARERQIALDSSVQRAEGEAEKLDRAMAQLQLATTRRDRLRRKAKAAQLLYETLVAHRDAAREKYAAPFAKALQHYASTVFGPGTQFALDENLKVTTRTVDGTTVDLDQLSGGAKEQMALLTRFAIADMVASGSDEPMPVPVVIDDALGATDPRRLDLMNVLFSQVGEFSQVFVLTCFPRRFDGIAPARLASIESLKNHTNNA